MEVPERPAEIKEELSKLFNAIEEKKLKEAKRLLAGLQKSIGTGPDLIKADVLIRRKEILNK